MKSVQPRSLAARYEAFTASDSALMQMALDYHNINYEKHYHIGSGKPKFVEFHLHNPDQELVRKEMEAISQNIKSDKGIEKVFNELVKGYAKVL